MSAITLNGDRALSARVMIPWRGVPLIDVDVDPELVASWTATIAAAAAIDEAGTPGGVPAVLSIASLPPITITGVIDPKASGTFVAGAMVRVVGGSGGWSKSVGSQHWPTQVPAQLVYATTGARVLEKVTMLPPAAASVFDSFARAKGAAASVFAPEVDWWVDPLTGVTFVGPRPPAVPDPSLEILEWDPATKTAIVACDSLVLPGTPLADPRIGDVVVTVRDVDQLFGPGGTIATCRCSSEPVSRLMSAMTTMVRELAGVTHLRLRRYRFVTGTSKLALQAVDRDPLTQSAAPLPDLLAVNESSGMAGVTAILPPSLEVTVGFLNGDPQRAIVLGFSTLAPPLELALDALALVDVGPSAALVKLAGGVLPLAKGDWASYVTAALLAFATACEAGPAGLIAASTALATALVPMPGGPMPLPITLKVTGA